MKRIVQSLRSIPFYRLDHHPDLVLAALVVLVVAVLILPMPSGLLDALLAANLTLSALVLLAVLLSERTLSLSSFPAILLLTTLFRLTLNVSTTRLILSTGSAGDVVHTFGHLVLSGDIIVGLVIFLIITFVQFIVIAKGAERVAEVGARFFLDSLPGKQISIDAALRSGAIGESEAGEQREELNRESQFYGSMDGAMKFIKGDAIAGLVITAINFVAGIVIGVLRFDMTTQDALETYSVLSVGDGLVSQIPSLLITLSAAILTTRAGAKEGRVDLGGVLRSELFTNYKVLGGSAAVAALLALVPGLPVFVFGALAIGLVLAAVSSYRRGASTVGRVTGVARRTEELKGQLQAKVQQAKAQRALTDSVAPALVPISIDFGVGLSEALGLSDDATDVSKLIGETLPALRDALYLETGIHFPGVRVKSWQPALAGDACVICVKDVPVATLTINPTCGVALETAEELGHYQIEATPTEHPLGLDTEVSHVPLEKMKAIEALGIRVWAPTMIVALHLTRVLRRYAKLFVGLQETGELVERLEKAYPTLVREVVPKVVPLAQLTDVLQRLVDEGVSIRDLKSILEVLSMHGSSHTDNVTLTELVRAGLSLQLAHTYGGAARRMPAVLLDEIIEDTIRDAIATSSTGNYLAIEPEIRYSLIQAIRKAVRPALSAGVRPIILTHSEIRRYVRKLIEDSIPEAAVLSFQELPPEVTIQTIGQATLHDEARVLTA